jgi:hypothetical protein
MFRIFFFYYSLLSSAPAVWMRCEICGAIAGPILQSLQPGSTLKRLHRNLLQEQPQSIEVNRLGDMIIESSLEAALDICVRAKSTQRHRL